jgi:hypothetical protein
MHWKKTKKKRTISQQRRHEFDLVFPCCSNWKLVPIYRALLVSCK